MQKFNTLLCLKFNSLRVKSFFTFDLAITPFLYVFIILSFRMRSYNRVCSHTECCM